MAQAMRGVTRAMQSMNRQLNLPQIQKIMMEFERQSEIMDMKEEMMGEAVDDAIADEGDEEETDAIVSQAWVLSIFGEFVHWGVLNLQELEITFIVEKC